MSALRCHLNYFVVDYITQSFSKKDMVTTKKLTTFNKAFGRLNYWIKSKNLHTILSVYAVKSVENIILLYFILFWYYAHLFDFKKSTHNPLVSKIYNKKNKTITESSYKIHLLLIWAFKVVYLTSDKAHCHVPTREPELSWSQNYEVN